MSRPPLFRALAALGLLFSTFAAHAQVGTGAVSYGAGGASQNFDTLASSGTSSTLPTGWYFREAGGTTQATYQADDGSLNTANVMSYGSAGASDRGFGVLPGNALGSSGTIVADIGARITNNSGAAITSLPISFVTEVWLYQGAVGESFAFEYSTDATSLTTGAWTAVAALNVVTPAITGTGKKDGNAAANRSAVTGSVSGLNVASGADIWIRWRATNLVGNDNGLAIDDVVLGVPVDQPPTLVSSVPLHNAIDVAVDTEISVTFSEPVEVSGAWYDFSCGSGTPTLTPSAGPATTYTFTPSGVLPHGRVCNLYIDGSLVLDQDGSQDDPMAGVELVQFTTVTDELPAVTGTLPLDAATDVSRAANLSVTFSEPVNAPAAAFGIFCPDTAMSSLPFALSDTGDTVYTLDPGADLPAATTCKLYVDNTQVTDQDGTADNPERDTQVFFTTAALTPPSVISTVPAKNSSDFPSAGDLQVVFDVSVTLAPGAFSLTCAASTGISLSHASSGSSFSIDTGTALVAGDTCTLTVEADAVTSGDGLHPDADEVVPFTVAGAVVPYYAQVNTSSQPQLRCSLNEIIDGHTAYPYTASSTDTWDILNLAEEDPVDSTKILDVYKNERYTKISGGTGIYNREHTWPNTYGFSGGSPGAYTDTHMLHATNTQYNSDRGSKPYADCNSGCTESPTAANYGVGGGGGGDSNYYLQAGSENLGSYEVWDHIKGNMARAMMYMVIRYEGENGEPDLELTDTRADITSAGVGGKHYMGLLTTLIAWHQADPVDAKEVTRNELIYSFQNNRNPFVDHPEWGTLALMNSTNPASCTLASGGNARPVGVDDLYAATQGALLTVSALDGVLDNDTDAEANALTAALIAQAIKGTVTLAADGSFTYAPNAGTCGSDAFTYQASDATGSSSVTIARINVACSGNQPPVANDATFGLSENSSVGTTVGTVVATDPDVGNTLSYSITAGNGSGAFTMVGNQLRVANAAPLNFEATPQFVLTVTVSDGSASDTAQITVNLSNVNEAPTANDATFGLPENSAATTVVGTVTGSDPDAGTSLTYSITGGNGSGAFAISGAGQITVANAAPLNFEATPQFVLTVQASDGSLADTAQVTINLTNVEEGAAVANDDAATVAEDSSSNTIAVLVNDSADPDGGALEVIAVGAAQHGTTSFVAGSVGYVPAANYCGTDTFTYTIAGGDTATVNVTVSCTNDAPQAGTLADRIVQEGVAISTFSVAGAFSDIDGDDLDFAQSGLPAGLTLDAETGAISGTPAAGTASGSPYTVTITATDGTAQVQSSFTLFVQNAGNRIFGHGFEN